MREATTGAQDLGMLSPSPPSGGTSLANADQEFHCSVGVGEHQPVNSNGQTAEHLQPPSTFFTWPSQRPDIVCTCTCGPATCQPPGSLATAADWSASGDRDSPYWLRLQCHHRICDTQWSPVCGCRRIQITVGCESRIWLCFYAGLSIWGSLWGES